MNRIVGQVFRALGPTILRSAIQGSLSNRPPILFAGDRGGSADDVLIEFDEEDEIANSTEAMENSTDSTPSPSPDDDFTPIPTDHPTINEILDNELR